MLVAVLLRCTNRLLLGCTKLYILRWLIDGRWKNPGVRCVLQQVVVWSCVSLQDATKQIFVNSQRFARAIPGIHKKVLRQKIISVEKPMLRCSNSEARRPCIIFVSGLRAPNQESIKSITSWYDTCLVVSIWIHRSPPPTCDSIQIPESIKRPRFFIVLPINGAIPAIGNLMMRTSLLTSKESNECQTLLSSCLSIQYWYGTTVPTSRTSIGIGFTRSGCAL